jgi:hypothetical protein
VLRAQIPFALPVSKDASVAATAPTSVSRVELDQATTARFRAVAKRHGATVTQLLNVLLALAEVQSALEWAAAGDSDQYAQAAVAYAQATHVFFAFTFVNHVRPFAACLCPPRLTCGMAAAQARAGAPYA